MNPHSSLIWVFPKILVPQNGWFIMWKTPLKWMIWGAHPYFWKHPYVCINSTPICLGYFRPCFEVRHLGKDSHGSWADFSCKKWPLDFVLSLFFLELESSISVFFLGCFCLCLQGYLGDNNLSYNTGSQSKDLLCRKNTKGGP